MILGFNRGVPRPKSKLNTDVKFLIDPNIADFIYLLIYNIVWFYLIFNLR